MKKFCAILLVFLFAYGCLNSIGGDSYTQNYIDDLSRVPISDPATLEDCEVGDCWCLVCESGLTIEAISFSNNLAGGQCYWETECTSSAAADLMSGSTPDLSIRQFMIGQGPSISDFSDAQPYCHYGLSMAVQWLVGNDEEEYDLPDAERAICLLTMDVIPLYVLYSDGEDISASRAREIGEIFATEGDDITLGTLTDGPVGPVIVVTEMNFETSEASLVANQVRAINDVCDDCFIAVGPKIGDTEALDALMAQPDMEDEVDLIAYGIDYRYVSGCNAGDIRTQALNFSRYALYTYNKPTVIPYILFDSSGSDVDGTCTWDENKMREAYSSFWPYGIQPLQQAGVIGLAPYSLFSSQYGVLNPLNCTDCDLGKNSQRLAAWFSGCQDYTNLTTPSGGFHRGGATPIMFSNGSSGFCNNAQFDYLMRQTQYASIGGGSDILSPQQSEMRDPAPMVYRCSACVSQNISQLTPPFAFEVPTGDPPEEYCTLYPEIETWADRRNVDPMLVRAFILGESGFDPCAAAKVCSADYHGAGCFPRVSDGSSECYYKAYDEMYDPAGNCTFTNAVPSDEPDWRWCAFGLMQTVIPPYTLWPSPPASETQPYEDVFLTSGFYEMGKIGLDTLEGTEFCAPPDGNFNPFNTSHSLCLGTAKMANDLQQARGWITAHRTQLNWGADDYERDSVFAAYIAGNIYGGLWDSTARDETGKPADFRCSSTLGNGDCWAANFLKSWTVDEEYCDEYFEEYEEYPYECDDDGEPDRDRCYGYTDFVEFVRDCEVEYLARPADGGANKMARYYWLRNGCEQSACPPGKQLLQAAYEDDWESHVPSSGSLYIVDEEES
ncbi:hypothetical protein KKB44_00530 [Candidatus Micrarchaeota archaeon]|nr:hypothetical protein [Candidatus Micrarchaeota archaeon]